MKEYGHGEHFQHTSADPVLRSRCFINQFHPPNGQLSTVDPLDHCPDFFCSDKCGSTEHTLVPRPPCLAGGKGDCRACCRPLFCNCWCFTNTTNTNLTGTQVLELGPQDRSLLWSVLVCPFPKLSPRFPPDFSQISPRFPPEFPKISPQYFPQISPRFPSDIPMFSLRFPQYFPEISPRFLQDFPNISL